MSVFKLWLFLCYVSFASSFLFNNWKLFFIGWLVLGANINAQTEETQETALTLACCGGFLEVADFLIKAGADIELGCSTPLMEAAQEGHLELVKYLLAAGEALL